MPYLGGRSVNPGADGLMHGVLGTASGAVWEGDEYRPSGSSIDVYPMGLPSMLAQRQQRRVCSNVECANGWIRPWRSRRRPIFEGQWACSGRCVLAMTQAAVQREIGDIAESTNAIPHRHRVPLGLLMLAQGWITHPQLRRALEAQRASGTGRIGDWLQSECGLEAERVTR